MIKYSCRPPTNRRLFLQVSKQLKSTWVNESDERRTANDDNSHSHVPDDKLTQFSPTIETLYELNKSIRDENIHPKINKRQFLVENGFVEHQNLASVSVNEEKGSKEDHGRLEGNLETSHKAHIQYIKDKMSSMPTPKELKAFLDKFIVGQEQCKRIMSVAVYNHYVRINDSLIRQLELEHIKRKKDKHEVKKQLLGAPIISKQEDDEKFSMTSDELLEHDNDLPELEKSNILVLGPSGSGKTLIAKTLAKVLKVPIVIQDCTSLTQAGYVGEDIESCIEKLFIKSDYDVDLTERGIIVLDELDKLAKPSMFSGTKDIAGEGVQQGLLKLIEGTNLTLQVKKQGGNSRQVLSGNNQGKENYTIDTSNILFITMGAFVGLDKLVTKRLGKTAKYNDKVSNKVDSIELNEKEAIPSLDLVTPEDLIKFGLIPEFIGRIPIIAALDPLTIQDLSLILTEPKNSILRQYEYSFEKSGVKLSITEPAIEKIAELSVQNGTGARGLRNIMEKLLLSANYDCPGSGISYILIDKEVIDEFIEKLGNSTLNEFKIKYYGRGDVYKFLTDIGREDEELMSKMEINYEIPLSSVKLDIHTGKSKDPRNYREFII